jgi:adenine deaminase
LAQSRGDEPADLVLRGGRLVNVFTRDVVTADLAVGEGRIAGWGNYDAREIVDLDGCFVLPGLIDVHTHLESSMLAPGQYAAAIVPRGITTIVCDPHEIANVCGLAGIRYLLDAAASSPLDVFATASSCVPATPLETAGATLGPAELTELLGWSRILGLGELMNFPGTIQGDPQVLARLQAAEGRLVDGHAPGVTGKQLQAYLAAGPDSDHECRELGPAQERRRAGMWVYLREGSSSADLERLAPLVAEFGTERLALCTDDVSPEALAERGHLDHALRRAVELGLDPLDAVALATLRPAERLGLHDRGALGAGRIADLVVVEDLSSFTTRKVYKRGQLVDSVDNQPPPALPPEVRGTCRTGPITAGTFALRCDLPRIRVIETTESPVFTRCVIEVVEPENGLLSADTSRDLLKLAVVERHRATGNVGLGLVRGFGLRTGALASSVAHDSHNIVVVGASDTDMALAVRAVAETGGGLVVASGGKVAASLPLPIAGLLSPEPLAGVVDAHRAVVAAARALGCGLGEPFMSLSFLALAVIPELKLTDRGLVDVARGQIVPIGVS